jgi:hypothetical protein
MNDQLKEHLKSLESAGSRTRTAVGVLVIACVLGFVGFLNSWKYGWMAQRARIVATDNTYAAWKLGLVTDSDTPLLPSADSNNPAQSTRQAKNPGQSPKQAADHLSQSLIKEYAESGFKNSIPGFGTVVDVYDLGLVGGLGYTTILLLLFYSLNTELTALRLAFSCAERISADTLKDFYGILATRQVLSIPKTMVVTDPNSTPKRQFPSEDNRSFRWLRFLPKTLITFPIVVYFAIIIYDIETFEYGWYVSPGHTMASAIYSVVFGALIVGLFMQCWRCLRDIDEIWDYWYKKIEPAFPPSKTEHEKDADCLARNGLPAIGQVSCCRVRSLDGDERTVSHEFGGVVIRVPAQTVGHNSGDDVSAAGEPADCESGGDALPRPAQAVDQNCGDEVSASGGRMRTGP